MVLTDAGERFRNRVIPLIAEFDRARDEAVSSTDDPTGVLRLTASVSFGQTLIVPLIPAFRAAFPRLTLELMLTDANLDLVEERIDLANLLAPSYGPGVIGAKLLDTRYRVVASSDYLAHRAHHHTRRPERARLRLVHHAQLSQPLAVPS